MKIYIADIRSRNVNGKSEGHYFSVAQNLKDVLSKRHNVSITGGPVYQANFAGTCCLPYDTNNSEAGLFSAIKTYINGKKALKLSNEETIIFQCTAITILLLLLTLNKVSSRVFLIQYDRMIMNSRLKRTLYKFAKKKITGVICPDDEIGHLLGKPYCVVPDYIYCEPLGNTIDQEPDYDFGFFGILAAGKGILEAVTSLAGTDYKVKIAGRSGKLPEDAEMMGELHTISKLHPNIELYEGYQTDEEYTRNILSVKYVVLNYSGSYELRSSGVILDAIYHRRPVLTTRRKLSQFVAENNVGVIYDDFKDLDLKMLISGETYGTFQRSIDLYLGKQTEIVDTLNSFIGR